MAEATKPEHLSIAHWTAADRSVMLNWTKETKVFGMITGTHVVLDNGIRADVVALDVHVGYSKVAGGRWMKEGDDAQQWQFISEPEDITEWRKERAIKLAAEIEAELEKRKEEAVQEVLDNARKSGDSSAGRGGAFDDDPVASKPAANQRKAAIKASRL